MVVENGPGADNPCAPVDPPAIPPEIIGEPNTGVAIGRLPIPIG